MSQQHAFAYELLNSKLHQFVVPDEHTNIMAIVKAQKLSPDCDAVVLRAKPSHYYVVYTNDFVQDLSGIVADVCSWYPCVVERFMEPREIIRFERTAGAKFFVKPDKKKTKQWMKYAVPVGVSYAFLLSVTPQRVGSVSS